MKHFSFRLSPSDKATLIISVPKKAARKAVTRNLIKRRVRAAFKKISPSPKAGKYLFIARAGAESVRGAELENELRSAMMV